MYVCIGFLAKISRLFASARLGCPEILANRPFRRTVIFGIYFRAKNDGAEVTGRGEKGKFDAIYFVCIYGFPLDLRGV